MLTDEIREIRSGTKELRSFGFLVGGVLTLLGVMLLWKQRPAYPWFLGIGAGLAVTAGLVPRLLLPFQKAWMALAVVLGWVMSRIILVVLYYCVITPISLIARVSGKQFLPMRSDRTMPTYWHRREKHGNDRESYRNQF